MEQVVTERDVASQKQWQCFHCSTILSFSRDLNGTVECGYCNGLLDIFHPFIQPKRPKFREIECRVCGVGEIISVLQRFVGSFKTPCCHQVLYVHPDSQKLFIKEEWEAQNRVATEPAEGVIIALIPE